MATLMSTDPLVQRLAGPAAAIGATVLLVLGLGVLLVAEYALVWQLLVAPWLNSIPWAGLW